MLLRKRRADAERLAEWVRLYADSLRGYLWTVVDDKSVVEDLLQEVFLRAWRGRTKYVDLGREKAYLFRIADRLAWDNARIRRPTAVSNDLIDSIDTLQAAASVLVERREDEERLADAMKSLSDAQRRAILLRYFGAFEYARIAQILNCSRNTALSHVHRGLRRLRRYLLREVSR